MLLLLSLHYGRSQHITTEQDSLLRWIAAQQVVDDPFYDEGLFRSQRINKDERYEDNTLFYSALIANTLLEISVNLPEESGHVIHSIHERVRSNAANYRSRRGRATYNFWQTNPDIPHPNGPVKYQQDKYRLPDDVDDTSTIGLLIQDQDELAEIRKEMVRYTSERKKRVRTTLRPFKKSAA